MPYIMESRKDVSPDEILKVVVIGPPRCGKTTLISSIFEQYQDGDAYIYNGVGVYPCRFQIGDREIRAALFEIPSQPDFSLQQRTPYYHEADVIVFMYAVDDPAGFTMLMETWVLESREIVNTWNTHVFYVGNKVDRRVHPQVVERLALEGLSPITYELGVQLAGDSSLLVECCALHWVLVHQVLDRVLGFINH